MDALSKFEDEFQKARTEWTKAQWRKVALSLAEIKPVETRGRKPKTHEQQIEAEQNILLADFWSEEERRNKESPTEAGVLILRTELNNISKKEALKGVINAASQRENNSKKKPSVSSVIRKIQMLQKNKRNK